jgi:hypothetical protein
VVGDGQELEVFAQDSVFVGTAELAHLFHGRLCAKVKGGEAEKEGVEKFHGSLIFLREGFPVRVEIYPVYAIAFAKIPVFLRIQSHK